MGDMYPECESPLSGSATEADGPNFIRSSESVGAGHEDSMNRMPKITNGEFPNTPSGEGCGCD